MKPSANKQNDISAGVSELSNMHICKICDCSIVSLYESLKLYLFTVVVLTGLIQISDMLS